MNQIMHIIEQSKSIQKSSHEILEPELRPEYVDKVKKIMRQESVDVSSVEDLKKRLGL